MGREQNSLSIYHSFGDKPIGVGSGGKDLDYFAEVYEVVKYIQDSGVRLVRIDPNVGKVRHDLYKRLRALDITVIAGD